MPDFTSEELDEIFQRLDRTTRGDVRAAAEKYGQLLEGMGCVVLEGMAYVALDMLADACLEDAKNSRR